MCVAAVVLPDISNSLPKLKKKKSNLVKKFKYSKNILGSGFSRGPGPVRVRLVKNAQKSRVFTTSFIPVDTQNYTLFK